MATRAGLTVLTCVSLALTACAGLPRSGPDDKAIESGAKAAVVASAQANYVLVDLSAETVPFFKDAPTSLKSLNTGSAISAPDILIGVGDVVSVSIFESSAGGLFIPSDAGARSGNFVTIPNQIVDRSGAITVPYAGRTRVAGKSTTAVQQAIVKALNNRAIEPQVIVSILNRNSSEVAVLGDINAPIRFQTNPSGDRILDAIARAGGISAPDVETVITLQRHGQRRDIPFIQLVKNPDENIYVRPGDIIYAKRIRRTYVSVGASGINGRINFEESDLSLAEAIGQSGGLLDNRANPAQVFLYRQVDTSILQRMGVPLSGTEGSRTAVVFRVNLRAPASFFATQSFQMRDKDILYVSNSPATELQKFLSIVNDVSSTASGVPADVRSIKRSVGN